MIQYSNTILERLVAPEIQRFTAAEIPDLVDRFPESKHWVSNHFLNALFNGEFKAPFRLYVKNFLHRVQSLFHFYGEARLGTLRYFEHTQPGNPAISSYLHAITYWDSTLLSLGISLNLFYKMNNEAVFKKNDGSQEQRSYELHNLVKHHATKIADGLVSDETSLPFWLVNSGLRSKTVEVTFLELADIISNLGELANELQDARSFVEKYSQQLDKEEC